MREKIKANHFLNSRLLENYEGLGTLHNKIEKSKKMASAKVLNYVSNAYSGWLEYAEFHCSCAHLHDLGGDVLNEVIAELLEKKDDAFLDDLLSQEKNGKTTGLDAYVLTMINRNAHLPRATFRWKYRSGKIDANVDVESVAGYVNEDYELSDCEERKEEIDPESVVEMINTSDLSPFAKKVFDWKFVQRRKLKDWEGIESKKWVYKTYQKTLEFLLHKHGRPTRIERRQNVQQLILF